MITRRPKKDDGPRGDGRREGGKTCLTRKRGEQTKNQRKTKMHAGRKRWTRYARKRGQPAVLAEGFPKKDGGYFT